MPVEITEEEYLTRFLGLFHHELCVIIDGVKLGTRTNPLSVKILADKRTSIVAYDDTVWIQHGDDFEYICISKVLGFVIVAYQELYNTLHHP